MTDPRRSTLDRLIARLSQLVALATDALEADPAQVAAWQEELKRQLARYHQAAYLAGSGATELSTAARAAVRTDLATQLRFLGQFALEIQGAADWQRGWNARAAMYAKSIQTPYWRGATRLLPLPAMPGDGTTACLTNCRCAWDVQELEGENNYDCTWVMGDAEHCQGCKQRASDWSPLKIREGVVQI